MQPALEQIKRHEGFESKPYEDSVGVLTIGYGTNIQDGITPAEAAVLLAMRLNGVTTELVNNLPAIEGEVSLNEPRLAVLINMAYNLGMPRLLTFKKMFAALAEGDFETASIEMLDSKWAKQVKGRAVELALQMRTGEWQTQ